MTRQRSEEVMRRYLTEVVAQGKLEVIDELAADDMVDHTQSIPGKAGLVAHVTRFRERNKDVELTVERVIAWMTKWSASGPGARRTRRTCTPFRRPAGPLRCVLRASSASGTGCWSTTRSSATR
ncbi:MAG: nuclear transport factor 2 family protein [Gammaproteobacteria bacterium]|nr:nuclear transport factor 2 family protein [Gammaproteobacteria bacterium]